MGTHVRTVAIVPAAGAGHRLGAGIPKAFVELEGRSLIEHALIGLRESGAVDEVVVAVPPGRTDEAMLVLSSPDHPVTVVAGGAERGVVAGRGHASGAVPARCQGTQLDEVMRPDRVGGEAAVEAEEQPVVAVLRAPGELAAGVLAAHGGGECALSAAVRERVICRMIAHDVAFHSFLYRASGNTALGPTAAVHWPDMVSMWSDLLKGYSVSDKGFGNFKLPLLFCVMLLPLVFNGAGRFSLDHLIAKILRLDSDAKPLADAYAWALAAVVLGLPFLMLIPMLGATLLAIAVALALFGRYARA